MNNYCLNRNELLMFIEHKLYNELIDKELKEIISQSADYWDINIISSNLLFSIILEQYLKKDEFDNTIISNYYGIEEENSMFFSIEQQGQDFIDFIFNYKMPMRRNEILFELNEAKQNNDEKKVNRLRELLKETFEEDLINTIQEFHAKKIHY